MSATVQCYHLAAGKRYLRGLVLGARRRRSTLWGSEAEAIPFSTTAAADATRQLLQLASDVRIVPGRRFEGGVQ